MGILDEIVRAPQLAGSEIESRGYFQNKLAGPAGLRGFFFLGLLSSHGVARVCSYRISLHSDFSIFSARECSGNTTTKSRPLLIVVCCVEMAGGVANLLAVVIESPLIVSTTALETTCTPRTWTAVRKDLR
jgi:hypothetical protein